ncbi:glucosyl-3-phosphoglycerate synthase [Corynebacterium sp. CNCTC7651]|uniref:glucosyl-3-phosphoglycerate synthase n=1 Tax=Corynebacterium sp. CNCTC7651 TaxID=2815361 RepID=UPI002103AA59|nr:glucosyl-3-phosphoglycerate synthase [Corynebacterium sp. CNCTC7651]UIZ92898.1 glucosyl-3-phosphoglycerate synthase [Corynebacterium sp. CNCTC7651]
MTAQAAEAAQTAETALSVSVVIPALNEEATVGNVVKQCLASSAAEVLVIDSDSTDATARQAAAAGATVLNWRDVDPREPWPGKGEALWRGVRAAKGDVVVFIDADVTTVRPNWVDALAAPFADPAIHLVKAAYQRTPTADGRGGGRVTELTAKPLLRCYFPELAHIEQPLAGEYAIRRSTALGLPFVAGYGVEAGLLIDVGKHHAPEAATQVSLGARTHRTRPLAELAPMADVVARTILARAGVLEPELAPAQRPPWRAG